MQPQRHMTETLHHNKTQVQLPHERKRPHGPRRRLCAASGVSYKQYSCQHNIVVPRILKPAILRTRYTTSKVLLCHRRNATNNPPKLHNLSPVKHTVRTYLTSLRHNLRREQASVCYQLACSIVRLAAYVIVVDSVDGPSLLSARERQRASIPTVWLPPLPAAGFRRCGWRRPWCM